MAGPLQRHFYKHRIKRYSRVLGSILGELRVFTNNKLGRLPLEYMGGLRDQGVASYTAGTLPMMTLKYIGMEVNTEKFLNKNVKGIHGGFVQGRRTPVFLDYEWSIRVKRQDEMFQIQEQIISAMYPTLDLLFKSDDIGLVEENLKMYLTSYDFTDSFEGDGEDAVYYDLTYMIRLEGGYVYGNNDGNGSQVANGNVIKEVIVELSVDKTPLKNLDSWITIYNDATLLTKFPASQPLSANEGAYLYSPTATNILEVVGSYTFIRT